MVEVRAYLRRLRGGYLVVPNHTRRHTTVRLHRVGEVPERDADIAHDTMFAYMSPFDSKYADIDPSFDPDAINIVATPPWDISVPDMLTHEELHHILNHIDGPAAARRLDRIYFDSRMKRRDLSGGI